jgi:hypothetical protein
MINKSTVRDVASLNNGSHKAVVEKVEVKKRVWGVPPSM